MTFRVGQKVICVDLRGTPGKKWLDGDKPTLGRIYEVTGHDIRDEEPSIFITGHPDWAFFEWRFRPIVERKTDISIFTQMLTPHGVDA